ncbi:MAG TPA: response regulator FixJ [Alphaproteobacteria bacterium]|nr:response regulator FixJ [Alphaproteobacteria bacterium]
MTERVVFVVDDDDAVRDSLSLLLEAAGHRVETFESAARLLATLTPDRQGCVIADVRMPGMDGLELQQQLLARNIRLPVIIITGHGDVPIAVRAMKAGAIDFLEKPFADEAILDTVRLAFARNERPRFQHDPEGITGERLAQLTQREREVLSAMVAGHPNKVIAHLLNISPRTVEIHRARVMEKTGARSLSHLVRLALEAGVQTEDS